LPTWMFIAFPPCTPLLKTRGFSKIVSRIVPQDWCHCNRRYANCDRVAENYMLEMGTTSVFPAA
jgi:hypothetical protein